MRAVKFLMGDHGATKKSLFRKIQNLRSILTVLYRGLYNVRVPQFSNFNLNYTVISTYSYILY